MKKFLRIYKRAPDYKSSLLTIILSGFIYSGISSLIATGIPLSLNEFSSYLYLTLLNGILIFSLPTIIYASIVLATLKGFKKRRAFLLVLINQFILFIGLIFPIEHMIWFFIVLIYSINLLSIHAVKGSKKWVTRKSLIIPLLYVGLVLFPVFSLYDEKILLNWKYNLTLLFVSAIILFLIIKFLDSLFKISMESDPQFSITDLVSRMITGENISLRGLGKIIGVPLDTLKLKKDNEAFSISIPWLHPGPVQNIGGGTMSSKIIKKLNRDGQGFFWHMPSSHNYDPVNLNFIDQVVSTADQEPENYFDEATKMITVQEKHENEEWKVHGQKVGSINLIILEIEGEDDYDLSIFSDLKEKYPNLVFVDSHNHKPVLNDQILYREEPKALKLRKMITKVIENLSEEEMKPLKIGYSYNKEKSAVITAVDGQTNILLSFDRNGVPPQLKEIIKKTSPDGISNLITMTTDAHTGIDFLKPEQEEHSSSEIKQVIKTALDAVKPGKIGLVKDRLKGVEVLRGSFYQIRTSVTMLSHLFLLLLGLFYIILFFLFL